MSQSTPFNESYLAHNVMSTVPCYVCDDPIPAQDADWYETDPYRPMSQIVPVCLSCRTQYLQPPTKYLQSRPCERLPQG